MSMIMGDQAQKSYQQSAISFFLSIDRRSSPRVRKARTPCLRQRPFVFLHPYSSVVTPLTLYRVVKEGEAQSRFEVAVRRGLTPLIGRDHEFGLLQERWARVKDGAGQVVLLSGEPGIGKSRLVEALKETVEPIVFGSLFAQGCREI